MRSTGSVPTWMQIGILALALLSSPAFADAFSVEVGQTKVMGVSRRVVGITVADPSVVEVRRLHGGGGVTLEGKELGKTEIALRTVDGNDVSFMLYVTSAGARVYQTGRPAPGHKAVSPAAAETEVQNPDVASKQKPVDEKLATSVIPPNA
jgi:Flp pilus assembly secretin CpaC